MIQKKENLTPVMKQYLEIKGEYKDSILLYRMGDFYELFFEDAVEGAKILNIALTSRDKNKENPIPMCGFPYHAAETYIKKLLDAGKRVAVCEQVEDPKKAKKIVKREVVKVLTPGTALEYEDTKENNFIAGIYIENKDWGLFFIDISTGESFTTEEKNDFNLSRLKEELGKFSPSEIVFQESKESVIHEILSSFENKSVLLNEIEDWYFTPEEGIRVIKESFGVKTLEGYGIEKSMLSLSAAGGLFRYLKKVRKGNLPEFKTIRSYKKNDYMVIDSISLRTLEIFKEIRSQKKEGSLFWVLDMTETSMGSRTLKKWLLQPLLNIDLIKERQDSVEELVNNPVLRGELRKRVKNIFDLDRLSSKISSENANPKDMISLLYSVEKLPEIKLYLKDSKSTLLKKIFNQIDTLDDIKKLIEKAIIDNPPYNITEGGIIKDGFSNELDELRKVSFSGKEYIASLEEKERKRTGINTLRVGYNKVFGFYIEISKAALRGKDLPPDFIRKQTLVNTERYISEELKKYEDMVMGAEEKIKKLEYELFVDIRKQVKKEVKRILKTSEALATLDSLLSLAEVAIRNNYKKPVVYEGETIEIVQGRHPVVEKLNPNPFVPNDTFLNTTTDQIIILTGPNMGGKSTYLRQVALITLLAQIGSFVPASSAKIGLTDRIFTRIGASDYLGGGQSTFMVEMVETANILNNSTNKSLILLDEIGRGTSTYDGMAIAWSVIEYLHSNGKIRPRTLFATHYHQLTTIEEYLKRVKNYHTTVRKSKKGIIFLYKVYEGPSDESFGIDVAKLAGIPDSVVKRAKEILLSIERRDGIIERKKIKEKLQGKTIFDFGKRESENEDVKKLEKIKEKIKKININEISPLQALLFLNELKEEIEN